MSVFNTSVTTVFLAPVPDPDRRGRRRRRRAGSTRSASASPPGSYFGYVLSLSVLLQVLVLPLTGAIADRSGAQAPAAGRASPPSARSRTMAMFFVADERYLLGAALFVVANLCFGAATVVYYSWLPDLAGARRAGRRLQPRLGVRLPRRGAAAGRQPRAVHAARAASGLTEGEAVRICLASAGIWWAGFTVVSVTLLRNRRPRDVEPGPDLRSVPRQLPAARRHPAGPAAAIR